MSDLDAALTARLQAVCATAGLDPDGAQLIKFTNNVVVKLRDDAAVVRIAGSAAMHRRTEKVVAVARWLAEHDFPAVRLLPGIRQPITVAGDLATVWEVMPSVGTASPADLGRLLRRLHALPAPLFKLPKFDPIDDVRWRLDHADGLDDDDMKLLRERCDAAEQDLSRLSPMLPVGPVHGDAHPGNLIVGAAGPVMCDFDSTCIGPREWDLVPMAFGETRFGDSPQRAAELRRSYGFDVRSWKGLDVLLRIRELKLVTSVVPVLRTNNQVRAEFRRRLGSLRTGKPVVWNRYS